LFYSAASFGTLYVADSIVWLLVGTILFTGGLYSYIRMLIEWLRYTVTPYRMSDVQM
jgi:hypothetical protein